MINSNQTSRPLSINILIICAAIAILAAIFFSWRYIALKYKTSPQPSPQAMSVDEQKKILANLMATTSPGISEKQQQAILKKLSASTTSGMSQEKQIQILNQLEKN